MYRLIVLNILFNYKLNGQQTPMQDNAKHLGDTIGKVLVSGDTDNECIIKSFNRSVNI